MLFEPISFYSGLNVLELFGRSTTCLINILSVVRRSLRNIITLLTKCGIQVSGIDKPIIAFEVVVMFGLLFEIGGPHNLIHLSIVLDVFGL